MQNLIKISNTEIQVKEYQGKRVCTSRDIDTLHQRPEGSAKRALSQNKKHFIEGEDYFHLTPAEMQSTKIVHYNSPKGLNLFTESGYLMLVKSFTDDLAWEVQRQLVNNYFRKPAPVPKPKTKRQVLEEKYIDALKSADQCKDVKEYHYGEYLKHEKQYRKFLSLENDFKLMAEHYKCEMRKLDQQKFTDMCIEASKMFPDTI